MITSYSDCPTLTILRVQTRSPHSTKNLGSGPAALPYIFACEMSQDHINTERSRCVNEETGEELILVLQKSHLVSSEGCEIRVRGPFHRVRNYVFGVKKLDLVDQECNSINFETSGKASR